MARRAEACEAGEGWCTGGFRTPDLLGMRDRARAANCATAPPGAYLLIYSGYNQSFIAPAELAVVKLARFR